MGRLLVICAYAMITDSFPWCTGPYILADNRNAILNVLSCIACGSQTRVALAYHDQTLESNLGIILICRFCLPGMFANTHV